MRGRFNLFPHKTGLENVMLAPVHVKRWRKEGQKLLQKNGSEKSDLRTRLSLWRMEEFLRKESRRRFFSIRRRQRQDSSCGAFCSRVMNKFVMRQSLLLLLTATIWGVAFVAQSVGMDYIGPFTFNVVRNVIGGLVLIPCIAVFHRTGAKEEDARKTPGSRKNLLLGGICCGVMLFVAGNLQQIGIQYTTVGKAGFITAMYIVLVPILSIFLGKKAGIKIWAAVALAVAGLYILCMTDGSFSLQKGDLFVLLSAFAFSAHILVIDHFAPLADGVKMSCIQFFVCALLSAVCMWLFEKPDMGAVLQAWIPVLYAGVFSCGVAYTLQIVGQRGMNPTVASLILSLESVISLIAGWVILGQALSVRELSGCVLMFAAIILAQLPERKRGA